MNVDTNSKTQFIKLLKSDSKYEQIEDTDDTKGNMYYLDVTATNSITNERLGFELKFRNSVYKDVAFEKWKLDNANADVAKGVYDRVYAVSVQPDGYAWFADVTNDSHSIEYHQAERTKCFNDHTVVDKTFVCYKKNENKRIKINYSDYK